MKYKILLLLVTCYCFNAVAQTASLVRDIYPGTTSSNSYINYIQYNNIILFVAKDDLHGEELWSTDGTTGNTFLVKDIQPGTTGSSINYFNIVNNIVYFAADNGANGLELWRTDGTNSGTYQVKDILPGSSAGFSNIYFTIAWIHNGSFYFTANTAGTSDAELWKSDGTTAGTQLVKDIRPGTSGSYPGDFYEFNNELFFSANNGANGDELWKTDGTTAGTNQVKDILPGSSGGFNSTPFTVVWLHNGSFYFTAKTAGTTDDELWKSDGTTAGTQLVKDIWPGTSGSNTDDFYEFNNELFFKANNGANGDELWKTDGTTAGTTQVKDILPGSSGGFASIPFTVVWLYNGSFYFTVKTSGITDVELWKSDGTAGGTQLVKDIWPGISGSYPDDFYEFNNELYFNANNGANGNELWKTDGTTAGTNLVKDIFPGSGGGFYSASFTVVWVHNGYFYFTAKATGISDKELWRSDGTSAGTELVKDIWPGTSGSDLGYFYEFNNELYFRADNGANGYELWKTDGTTAGTNQLKDLLPGTNAGLYSMALSIYFTYNGSFYFQAHTSALGDRELWKSDGTTNGTVLVQDIYSGANSSDPRAFIMLPNDYIIFLAQDATNGRELWSFYLPGVTSINEISNNEFALYPNPVVSGGLINIKSDQSWKSDVVVNLFTVTGEFVQSKRIQNLNGNLETSFQIPELPSGVYILESILADKVRKTSRIIVLDK